MAAVLQDISRTVANEMGAFERIYKEQFVPGDDLMTELFAYISAYSGKRIRPVVFFLVQGLKSRPETNTASLAVMLELFHVASLLHDDVIDNAETRRKHKTVHEIWGNKAAILTGDYLLAKVIGLAAEWPQHHIIKIVASTALHMGSGELRQNLSSVPDALEKKSYMETIRLKTAVLFRTAAELGGLVSSASSAEMEALKDFGEKLGLAFQIQDDILDLTGHEIQMGKPRFQDLNEKKATLPIILAYENAAQNIRDEIVNHLNSAGKPDVERMRVIIDQYEGVERAKSQLNEIKKEAAGCLRLFHSSVYKESLLKLVE